MARRESVPADVLLHPAAFGALVLLVLNDHVLKAAFPGPITGKLSDVAGLILAPLVLVALVEVGLWVARRTWGPSAPVAIGAVVAVGLAFGLAKATPWGAEIYRVGMGLAQWPFAALAALIASRPIPAAIDVRFVQDPSDMLALAALVVPLVIGLRRARPTVDASRVAQGDGQQNVPKEPPPDR